MRNRSSKSEKRATQIVGGLALLALVATLSLPAGLIGQEPDDDWCDDDWEESGHCEIREFTLSAGSGRIAVDAGPNGGVQVEGWDRNEVSVQAKVAARASSEDRARAIVSQIRIDRDGTVHAEGPRTERREGWWVSYRVFVPRDYDLDLDSTNGGVSVEGVSGQMDLRTTNGGVSLTDVGGEVRARTTNGGVTVRLSGSGWEGAGLDAQTTNGGVRLYLPDGYSAHLVAGTTNGGFEVDFPVTIQGRIGRQIETDLGGGGASIRVATTNGGVRVSRTD